MSDFAETVEPAAKRARIASPAPAVAEEESSAIASLPAATTPLEPALAAPAAPVDPFSFEGETGLFGSLGESIGLRPSSEPEVGITEYIDPSVAAISGIIKHRYVASHTTSHLV